MNAPDRYERFVVPEGTKKVSYERDTKIINAASFTIEREDHTIGNTLRMQLHKDPNVLFAGYKLPHPLQYKIIIRIHTTSQSSPMQAYNQSINDLDKELDTLKTGFEVSFVSLSFVWVECDGIEDTRMLVLRKALEAYDIEIGCNSGVVSEVGGVGVMIKKILGVVMEDSCHILAFYIIVTTQ